MRFRGVGFRVYKCLNGVTLIITLLITNLLSPLPLQVGFRGLGFRDTLPRWRNSVSGLV